MCLALACDIRIASSDAWFRPAGINNGLTAAELGLSYNLPRAVGSSRAFEIMLTGRDVSAEEASRIGLVSEMAAPGDLLNRCYEIGERIAGFSRPGVELTKRMLWAGLEASGYAAHMRSEMNAQLLVRMTTRNFEEAVLAGARSGTRCSKTDGDNRRTGGG